MAYCDAFRFLLLHGFIQLEDVVCGHGFLQSTFDHLHIYSEPIFF